MERYIDADSLLKKIWYDNSDSIVLRSYAAELVKAMPAADVAPKSEVERLEAYNANLRAANAHVLGTLQDEIKKAKTEAIKDFAERLKGEMQNIARVEIENKIYFLVGVPFIDDIETQMLEEA